VEVTAEGPRVELTAEGSQGRGDCRGAWELPEVMDVYCILTVIVVTPVSKLANVTQGSCTFPELCPTKINFKSKTNTSLLHVSLSQVLLKF
jgi:hypothetical protein